MPSYLAWNDGGEEERIESEEGAKDFAKQITDNPKGGSISPKTFCASTTNHPHPAARFSENISCPLLLLPLPSSFSSYQLRD